MSDQPVRLWQCEMEPLPDGRWCARCPKLGLSATGGDAASANANLMKKIEKAERN